MSSVDPVTCEQVFRKLNDYLDRELEDVEMQQVAAHLETCAQCASEHAFEATMLSTLKEKLRRVAVPPTLLEKVQRILSAS